MNLPFEVQKGNVSVWKFHERFGAVKSAETTDSFTYGISNEAILKSLERYRKYLPLGITVSYQD